MAHVVYQLPTHANGVALRKHHGARGFRVSGIAVDTVTPRSSAKSMYCGIEYISPCYNSTLEGGNRGRWPEVRRKEVQKTLA